MSGRRWTPYQVEIILHHYCSPARFPRWTAPGYEEEIAWLIGVGILEARDPEPDCDDETHSHIACTEKGRIFVQMLLATPMPRSVWLDPRDGKEVMEERHGTMQWPTRDFSTLIRTAERASRGLETLTESGEDAS